MLRVIATAALRPALADDGVMVHYLMQISLPGLFWSSPELVCMCFCSQPRSDGAFFFKGGHKPIPRAFRLAEPLTAFLGGRFDPANWVRGVRGVGSTARPV